MQRRKNGREVLAPLGTQPQGVSHLSGTCSTLLYSGLLLSSKKAQPDNSIVRHCLFYLMVEHEFSSTQRRSVYFSYQKSWVRDESGVLSSTSEHRESWEQSAGRD